MNRAAIAFLLAAALTGCGGPPRFDSTNEATVKASAERLTAGMTKEQAQEFVRASLKLTVLANARERFKARGGPPAPISEVYRPIHGLTAAEIVARAQAAP